MASYETYWVIQNCTLLFTCAILKVPRHALYATFPEQQYSIRWVVVIGFMIVSIFVLILSVGIFEVVRLVPCWVESRVAVELVSRGMSPVVDIICFNQWGGGS